MNEYEELIERSEYCIEMAAKQTDDRLITFWCHASTGFRMRAENLELSEVIA